jgi:hypothetical protein
MAPKRTLTKRSKAKLAKLLTELENDPAMRAVNATMQLVAEVKAPAAEPRKLHLYDEPPMIARRDKEVATRGKSYEEENWAKLSPKFREAHNKLRHVHGLPPIPPPKIDLYVPPKARKLRSFDPTDKEFVAVAREFMQPVANLPKRKDDEGFTINGMPVKF